MDKIIIKEGIVVEGRYDKNTLSQVVDTVILQTDGFGIFKNKEQMELLKKVAKIRGLIVFTDGDGAGFVIRNKIKTAIPKEYLKHAYPPDIEGKEKRKNQKSKEGLLGVEGMTAEILVECLRKSGATIHLAPTEIPKSDITSSDMLHWGLTGGENSSENRKKLLKELDLPLKMTKKGLQEVLNCCYTRQEVEQILEKL